MNKKILIGVIVAAGIILFATVAYMMQRQEAPTVTSETDSPTATQTETSNKSTSTATITYTNDGFKPSTITVKKGTAITVVNNSAVDVMFSSADHPTHEEQTELNMKMLRPNESGTVTPTKVGTWGYHDHIDAAMTGSIIVTE